MPSLKKRHIVRDAGAVTVDTQSLAVPMGEFTKGVLYFSGAGARAEVQASPDDGTSWFILMRPNAIRGRYTLPATDVAYAIPIMPSLLRVHVDLAGLTGCLFEGSREVA